jgi:hypothetical protein
MVRLAALALLVAAICGCSTRYQSMGFTGGVAAQQMTSDTFRISARGNSYTSTTTIQDYMMLKAAETTKQVGGSHFIIVSAADASRTGYITTPGQARTTVVGNTAYTSYSPGSVYSMFKPGQDAYVRVVPANTPGAISADEIIQFIGSRVKRG